MARLHFLTFILLYFLLSAENKTVTSIEEHLLFLSLFNTVSFCFNSIHKTLTIYTSQVVGMAGYKLVFYITIDTEYYKHEQHDVITFYPQNFSLFNVVIVVVL